MIIRKANKTDLDNIMSMYKSCIKGMIANDIEQWDETYPNTEVITKDLEKQSYYVSEIKDEIIGGINIDLLVVNLYPFKEEAIDKKLKLDRAIEYIDIGGPSMLRAASLTASLVVG